MTYHPHIRKHKKNTHWLDVVVSIVAIVSPILTLPQVILIYSSKNADGISIVSWSAFVCTSIIWLLYGFAHKEKPIIINSIIGGTLSMIVVVGAVLY